MSGVGRRSAVRVIMASMMKRDKRLAVFGYLLAEANPKGNRRRRRAGEIKSPEATVLVVKDLNNDDPLVRAHLLKQLRWRNVPGSMSLLIRMVDSPHDTAGPRETLPEFTIRQYLVNFETMPEELRPTAGHIVHKSTPRPERCWSTDEKPVARPPPPRCAGRPRHGHGRDLEKSVIELLNDEDHMVRIAAADALADCDTLPTWEALRDAMLDRSVAVQEVAEKAWNESRSLAANHARSWRRSCHDDCPSGRNPGRLSVPLDSLLLLGQPSFKASSDGSAVFWLVRSAPSPPSSAVCRSPRILHQRNHNSQSGLFDGLCKYHQLPRNSRSLLRQLAASYGLAAAPAGLHRAPMARTEPAKPLFRSRAAELASLRERCSAPGSAEAT